MDPHRVLIILPSNGRDFVPVTPVSDSGTDSDADSDSESVASDDSFKSFSSVITSTENVGYTFN